MNSFSIVRKKTPFQKHKEEEEAKKKRDAEENERLYKEFVESFQGNDTPGSKTFVRGGMINPNDKLKTDSDGGNSKDGVSVSKKGSRYVPSFVPPPMANKGRESEKKKEDEKPREKEKGKTRNIDNFMEELRHEQERRERRNNEREQRRESRHHDSSAPSSRFDELPDDFDPSGKTPGSFDDGDPQTTNLYVGNLSPQVDENFLLRTFGRFGPIASVKIMWPRTEEEKRRQRNCGFVAFMNRADGQAAKDEMQGVVVYDYELKIGWGKSVSLPSHALPAPPPGQMAIRNKEGDTIILSGPGGPPVTSVTSQNSELVLTPNVPDITVFPPDDDHLRHVIDTMSLHVLDDGCAFEQAIMERGRGNKLFNFLFELGSKEHIYYVWRLYSFAQGDTLQRWRTEPFIMFTGSGRWIPPPLPHIKSPEHERQSSATFAAGRGRRMELECTLTEQQRDKFEDMLRALTLERSAIKEGMGFALDNADAAGEVVEVLTESLTLKETPIATKVARLMLVSDILHNSSAPVRNASAYRTKFEATLPDIMESFNDLYCNITGRITAQALKERVLKVLQVWEDWFLFSDTYVNGLRVTFLRSGNMGVILFHSLYGDTDEVDIKISSNEMSEGGKLIQDSALAIGKEEAMKELLGLPIVELERRCRHNGLSLCGGREMMVARLLSLEDAEKERIFNQDDDPKYNKNSRDVSWMSGHKDTLVGSTPSNASGRSRLGEELVQVDASSSISPSTPFFVTPRTEARSLVSKVGNVEPALLGSKWTHDDVSDDENRVGNKGPGLSYSSSGSGDADGLSRADEPEVATSGIIAQPEAIMSDEHRQKLRRLEIAVMEYRESIEARGIHSIDEIEDKVAICRRKLQSEFGISNSTEGILVSNKSSSERETQDQKGRHHNTNDHSRKRCRSKSRSVSPQKRSATRHKEKEIGAARNLSRHHDRDKTQFRKGQDSRERSISRER